MSVRRAVAAFLISLSVALPAAAYIPPVWGILRRLGERRASLSLQSLEVHGTLSARGETAERLAAAAGLPAAGREARSPARFQMKVPGRCRLEITPSDVTESQRQFIALRDGKLTGSLSEVPAAAALVRSACALLASATSGNVGETYAAAMSRRGIVLRGASLGRFDGRIAYVVGGKAGEAKPMLFVEKGSFQPLRLISAEGNETFDVRLVGWGSPMGGDYFPRAVEVFSGETALLRLETEKATPNPKLAEALFP